MSVSITDKKDNIHCIDEKIATVNIISDSSIKKIKDKQDINFKEKQQVPGNSIAEPTAKRVKTVQQQDEVLI
jgi:hypothetical protein